VSDGDLMEGIASEAASLAGHLQLGKLIYLYDDNRVTLSAATDMTFTEDRAQRFDAYGWHTETVADGNDVAALAAALAAARAQRSRPSLILVRTHLGFGSPNKQDSFEAHGSPLGVAEVKLTKQSLGWPEGPQFFVPLEAAVHFQQALEMGKTSSTAWRATLVDYNAQFPELAAELQQLIDGVRAPDWHAGIPDFPADANGMATRVASGKVMNAIAPRLPALIGGSADLDPSTFTSLTGWGDFQPPGIDGGDRQGSNLGGWSYAGRNLHFGVREHAMGAIMNGMAAHGGALPFGATFLVFSDYMRPSIRLAALMGLHVVHVFTHDSIALGEDGSTHQPVEQLAALRAIPRLIVIRPGDANETAEAWRLAAEASDRPFALVLTRQSLPTLDRSDYSAAAGVRCGAYILSEATNGKPDLILIACGSELALIVAAQLALQTQGIQARVVSMPSWELFEQQSQDYRDAVLPPALRARLAVEAGIAQGWQRYVGDDGDVLSIEQFGASAPGDVLQRQYGFTVENVCKHALNVLHVNAQRAQ
jgi:transketolase